MPTSHHRFDVGHEEFYKAGHGPRISITAPLEWMMRIRLPEHSHCLNCGDPVATDESYCSNECRLEREAREKRGKRRNMLFYLAAIVAIVAVWLYSHVL